MKPSDVLGLLARQGVMHLSEAPAAARSLSRLVARGLVVRMFPQVYVHAGMAHDLRVRCAALLLWDPDAVIAGIVALRFLRQEWRQSDLHSDQGSTTVIEFHSTRKKWAPPGFRLHRSAVPPEDVSERAGLRLTAMPRTVVHLARVDAGSSIDDAFREHGLTFEHLQEAFARAKGRWGNRIRHVVIRESRDEPWSMAERIFHRILRAGGIGGWSANLGVRDARGRAFIDVAFPEEMVAVEVDGRATHGSAEAFELDRERQNRLVALGWRPLRLTWAMLQNPARVLDLVRETLLTAAHSRVV